MLKVKKPKNKNICSICHADLTILNSNNYCNECKKNDIGIQISDFDLKDQITSLVNNEYDTILKYKGKLVNANYKIILLYNLKKNNCIKI
jgi:hypothetical protein